MEEHAELAHSQPDWHRWWSHVSATAVACGALTDKTMGAHAAFSLWFGHRYFHDPRCTWLSSLLAADDGALDFRRLGADLDVCIDLARDCMEFCGGETLRHARQRLSALCARFEYETLPRWDPLYAQEVMHHLHPALMDLVSPVAIEHLVQGVEKVSLSFDHGPGTRWPLLLALPLYGIDAWRDPGLVHLNLPNAQVLTLSPQALLSRLRQQATGTAELRHLGADA